MEEESVEEILRDLFYNKLEFEFEKSLREIIMRSYIYSEYGFIQLWID